MDIGNPKVFKDTSAVDLRRLKRLAKTEKLLSTWERSFCFDMADKLERAEPLSPKESAKLMEIEMEKRE